MIRVLSILLALLAGSYTSFGQIPKTSFYFSAHPDDWQLFMGVNAFDDITDACRNNNRVVFIYTTAGEANCSGGGVNMDYILARQDAASRSIQFCADIYAPHSSWTSSYVTIPGLTQHSILKSSYKNIVCYFLRLPDGCFEQTPLSIMRLYDKVITTLPAADNSTTYTSYDDLVLTVKNIVALESNVLQNPEVWLNASEWDPAINTRDHPDHIQTGRLATEVGSKTDYASVRLFEGYGTCEKPQNLEPGDVAKEAALQSQVCYLLTERHWPTEWDPDNDCGHVSWTSRNYYRVFRKAATTRANSTMLTISPNPVTDNDITLTYEMREKGPVNIVVFDMLGNIKGTLVNESQEAGAHVATYNISSLASGNYIIYAKTPGLIHTVRFTKL